MFFLMFNLTMLILALMARFRSPQWGYLPVAWFFISLLPCELPWLFALLHIALALPGLLAIAFSGKPLDSLSLLSLLIFAGTQLLWIYLHRKTFRADSNLQAAFAQDSKEYSQAEYPTDLGITANPVSQDRDWLKPFSFARPGVERFEDIAYGTHPRQRLDILRLSEKNGAPTWLRPVLLHVHGGGWIIGKKHQQGQPLLYYLAQQGWLCLDINYRLAPEYHLPDGLVDIKIAIAWARQNIKSLGGDPDFIAISGESAGGHLCALTALTANDPELQPGFSEVDTAVQATVPLYGIYDFTNSSDSVSGMPMRKFLTRYVMPESFCQAPELWRKLSPLERIHTGAPPFFVLQGSSDCLALMEETRSFVEKLKATSKAPAILAEIEGAQHGFELFHGVRAEFTIVAIARFLRHHYAQARAQQRSNQEHQP